MPPPFPPAASQGANESGRGQGFPAGSGPARKCLHLADQPRPGTAERVLWRRSGLLTTRAAVLPPVRPSSDGRATCNHDARGSLLRSTRGDDKATRLHIDTRLASIHGRASPRPASLPMGETSLWRSPAAVVPRGECPPSRN